MLNSLAGSARPLALLLLPLLAATGAGAGRSDAPCIRLTHAGTQVQGDVRICPGRYRIPDPSESGVIIIASGSTRLDLNGVTLESGDSLASRFVGIGVLSRGVEHVTITGGTIRGYRYNIRIEGGRNHRISEINLSGSRTQRLWSTPDTYDERDWLDIFEPDTFEQYGAGLYLKWTDGASVTGVTATGAQNGIALFGARNSYLADNDVSDNSGWGISLWSSARNTIVRNDAHDVVRCESPNYSRGCDSAALLLRQQSDSNFIADNNLSGSGDGFFLSGQRPQVRPSAGNVVIRNNASGSYHNAFESTFSWNNTFLENRADSSAYGFWLGYSTGSTVQGNTIIGSREAGIAIEHGSDNLLAANVIIGGRLGIHLFAPHAGDDPSRGYRIDDNVLAALDTGIVLERTGQSRIRGNVIDGVTDGLVIDAAGHATTVTGNIFLRATGWWIVAPDLAAGGNYWAAPSADSTSSRVKGRISVLPWKPASAAGY